MSDFKTNDLVWGKVKGYPSWPAVVIDSADAPKDVAKADHAKGALLVRFFGEKSFAWFAATALQEWNKENNEKNQPKRASMKLKNAVSDADEFKKTGKIPEHEKAKREKKEKKEKADESEGEEKNDKKRKRSDKTEKPKEKKEKKDKSSKKPKKDKKKVSK